MSSLLLFQKATSVHEERWTSCCILKTPNITFFMGYFQILKKNQEIIGFGFLNAFFAGLGQTHFISIFNPIIMDSFALSHSQYGSLYSLITLISGVVISFTGPLIDRYDIRYFCLFISLGLFLGLLQILLAGNLFFLGLGLFGLRFFGQGLGSSVSSISIARYFTGNRGKALSLSQMGFPFYEILVTPLFAFLLNFFEFQTVLMILMLIVIVVYSPLSFHLTGSFPEFNKVGRERGPQHGSGRSGNKNKVQEGFQKSWTRGEVFKDKTIYFLLGQALIPPFALTGLFFHQTAIAEIKNWNLSLMASGLIFFGLGRVINTFATGPLVDKYKATTLFPLYQLPMCLGLLILAWNHQYWVPFVCFFSFGLTVGSGGPIKDALWVELYGVRHLGSLKSLFATFMIFSTAAAPAFFGYIIEKDQGITYLLYGLLAGSLLVSLLSFIGLRTAPTQTEKPTPIGSV